MMDNLTEIKSKLDNYYQEYRNNKNTLSTGKTKAVAGLIHDILSLKEGNPHDIAVELSRFSADVTNEFFESITKSKEFSLDVTDNVLKEFYAMNADTKYSQFYVKKYASAITLIMKHHKEDALKSALLPKLVAYMACFASKSDKNKSKLYNLINNTAGGIFSLDYSDTEKSFLANIWNAVNSIYPDLSKAKYESLIMEWGRKYGFINDDAGKAPTQKENAVVSKVIAASTPKESAPAIEAALGEAQDKNNLRDRDKTKEKESIITALANMIAPIGKAFESIQGEIDRSRKIGAENLTLRGKIDDLEHQLSEQSSGIQEVNRSLMGIKAENDELKKHIAALESENAELDSKLNDAYSINSREASLEAEKIRTELKKAFAFLYEDWLEYEFSDVSEENYESLQAIIKKIFRSLERNGIDFKGNNQ